MNWISDPQIWIAILTLTALEIVLGIDNIIFISILSDKLPENKRSKARFTGLSLAMLTRIGLLFSISLIMKLKEPLFDVLGRGFSGRDLILIAGGLFLLGKSTHEIHDKLEGEELKQERKGNSVSFSGIITQILVLDIVFSLDSVITAVGMTNYFGVMVAAIIIAVGFMMLFSKSVSDFVHKHPTIKMLALSFLLLIGVTLIVEGFGQEISKGYIYFAMAFSFFVEMLNLKLRKKMTSPVKLREQSPE